MHGKQAAGIAVALALFLGVAACGDDDGGATATTQGASGAGTTEATTSGGSTASTTAATDVDPDGVLRVADDLATRRGGIGFDPAGEDYGSSWKYLRAIYGSLLGRNADGSYKPELATAWEIIDPRTVELELREGVEFTDGTPFDADAVRFNILRVRDAKRTGSSIELKQVSDVEVVDDHTVRIHLTDPVAGWLFSAGRPFFSSLETLMPSPAAIQAGIEDHPVGAGPFEFVSYAPEDKLVLEKSPTYWDADAVRLAGVEFVYVETGPSQILALRSGQVDTSALSSNLLPEVQSATDLAIDRTVTGRQFWAVYLCKSVPPFDDVKVREAINYAIDRDAIIAGAMRGNGEPITGLLPEGDPFHDPDLDGHFTHDPERAEQLLAEAGATDLSFDLMLGGFPPGPAIGEILQAQLQEVGVTLNLKQVQDVVREFFQVPGVAAGVITPGNDYGIADLTPGGIGNACAYDDPTLNGIVADIKAAEPGSDEQVEQVQRYQQYIVADQALVIWLLWDVEVHASVADRVNVGNFVAGPYPAPREYDLTTFSLKA